MERTYPRPVSSSLCQLDIVIFISAIVRLQPVFSRPGPATRSRSSTCTSSSGADTPPLSPEESSSQSDGSQSSIDLSRVNVILSNTTHPVTNTARDRVRARAKGEGHRRRISQAHASRSSVYETIEEEMSSASSAPASPQSMLSEKNNTHDLTNSSVFIVDPESASVDSVSMWDDESGITALRKYYTLREEAQDTVIHSKRVWMDTPFSLYAIQSRPHL
jgi:serine/arginine repetitive matrix protein 2